MVGAVRALTRYFDLYAFDRARDFVSKKIDAVKLEMNGFTRFFADEVAVTFLLRRIHASVITAVLMQVTGFRSVFKVAIHGSDTYFFIGLLRFLVQGLCVKEVA